MLTSRCRILALPVRVRKNATLVRILWLGCAYAGSRLASQLFPYQHKIILANIGITLSYVRGTAEWHANDKVLTNNIDAEKRRLGRSQAYGGHAVPEVPVHPVTVSTIGDSMANICSLSAPVGTWQDPGPEPADCGATGAVRGAAWRRSGHRPRGGRQGRAVRPCRRRHHRRRARAGRATSSAPTTQHPPAVGTDQRPVGAVRVETLPVRPPGRCWAGRWRPGGRWLGRCRGRTSTAPRCRRPGRWRGRVGRWCGG